ncbi:helix-turn-helix domain-containing protein [Paucisalibacillus sp. EB02]|uniref:helix-turn-helix domain-containing protein n=1 Tax=Paucisalibacillus sp. EB02 TaxID=1347087 RepID=UPI0005AB127C|nr:helix-turn-helix transcriptional regulator [Paucisalibacillus sp. EB02]
MLQGEIIKFYREKNKMTQAQLAEGICTTTHISKIERGKTAYSEELITLFSERLSIDIKKEMENAKKIDLLLQQWHQSMIMGRRDVMEQIKTELEEIAFIHSTYYAAHYRLLQARYNIVHQRNQMAFEILEDVKKTYTNLSTYEYSLLHHIYGIYYIGDRANVSRESHLKPLQSLEKVNIDEYGNEEYYYHLAISYHLIGSHIMAYYYAEKALGYFQSTNNYARSIDAETFMLLQMNRDDSVDFHKIVERYNNLIHNCDMLGFKSKKAILLNNLGFEYFHKDEFVLSKNCHWAAMQLDEPNSASYLLHLYNYLDSCMEGNLSRKNMLLNKIKEGLSLAQKLDSKHFIILFQLIKLKALGNNETYYQFIEEKALPHFSSMNHFIYYKRYGKILFEHYIKTNQYMKASKVLGDHL